MDYYTLISPLVRLSSQFFYRPTPEVNIFASDMLKPFTSTIWLFLILTLFLVSVAMHFIIKCENRLKVKMRKRRQMSSAVVMTFGTMCQQGTEVTSHLVSGRCLTVFLLLTSLVIYNFYTSVLVSTLVGTSFQTSIHSLIDLANSKFEIGFEYTSYLYGYLKVNFSIFIRSNSLTTI